MRYHKIVKAIFLRAQTRYRKVVKATCVLGGHKGS